MTIETPDASAAARHAEKMRRKKAARDKIVASKTREKGLLIVHNGQGQGQVDGGVRNGFPRSRSRHAGGSGAVREGGVDERRAHESGAIRRAD